MKTRINKLLSQRGVCSRREADRLIEAGLITVNGKMAVPGDKIDEDDYVEVKGRPLKMAPSYIYIMLHKPVGLICTTDRTVPDNVIDYVGHKERLFPIGRLDVESSGLLILTNDGELANQLTHPKYQHEKEYAVTLDEDPTPEQIEQLRKGVVLEDGPTQPAKIRHLAKNKLRIIIKEGRNRQIRRVCEAVGLQVIRLKRVRIHTLELGRLPSGSCRDLKQSEVKKLKNTK